MKISQNPNRLEADQLAIFKRELSRNNPSSKRGRLQWPAPIYWRVGGIFWIALFGRKDFTIFEFWHVKWKCNSEAGNFLIYYKAKGLAKSELLEVLDWAALQVCLKKEHVVLNTGKGFV